MEAMEEIFGSLAELSAEIEIERSRRWYDFLLFWRRPKKTKLNAVAKQSLADPELFGPNATIAEIEFYRGDKLVFRDDVPWMMPPGEIFLLLQIYTLAKFPDYQKPKQWQTAMEAFCLKFPDFEPPAEMYWRRNEESWD